MTFQNKNIIMIQTLKRKKKNSVQKKILTVRPSVEKIRVTLRKR